MDKNFLNHKSIMLREVLDILNPKPNETYVDCTLGAGGHTKAILDLSLIHI